VAGILGELVFLPALLKIAPWLLTGRGEDPRTKPNSSRAKREKNNRETLEEEFLEKAGRLIF